MESSRQDLFIYVVFHSLFFKNLQTFFVGFTFPLMTKTGMGQPTQGLVFPAVAEKIFDKINAKNLKNRSKNRINAWKHNFVFPMAHLTIGYVLLDPITSQISYVVSSVDQIQIRL